jgi:hypothetical protein
LVALLLFTRIEAVAALHATKPALQHECAALYVTMLRVCLGYIVIALCAGNCMVEMCGWRSTALHANQHCSRAVNLSSAAAAKCSADTQSPRRDTSMCCRLDNVHFYLIHG